MAFKPMEFWRGTSFDTELRLQYRGVVVAMLVLVLAWRRL